MATNQMTKEHLDLLRQYQFSNVKIELEKYKNENEQLKQENEILQKECIEIKNHLNNEINNLLIENQKLKDTIHQLKKYKQAEAYKAQIIKPEYKSFFKNTSTYYRQNMSAFLSKSRLYKSINKCFQSEKLDIQQVEIIQKERRLIESFFIIGSDIQQLSASPNNQNLTVSSSYGYQYPQQQIELWNKSILGSIFPFGNQTEVLDDFDDVIEIVNYSNINYLKNKLLVFIVPTDQTKQVKYANEDIIRFWNPDLQLYGICITVEDFTKGQGNKYIKYQKSYGILTYFPIIELFQEILVNFITYTKMQRQTINRQSEILDGFEIIKKCELKFKENLDIINKFVIQIDSQTIQIQDNQCIKQIQFIIPKKEEIPEAILKWSAQIVFKLFKAQEIIQIYQYLLLEQNCIFISENQQYLSATMQQFNNIFRQFFLNLLSPIKWIHDLIFSINESIVEETIKNSENPFIIGINIHFKDFQKQYIEKITPQQNIILVYIDKVENKISITDEQYLNQLMPENEYQIQELDKFKLIFNQNRTTNRFSIDNSIEIVKVFREGMKKFLFDKIQPDFAISNGIYNLKYLFESMAQQIDGKHLKFIHNVLSSSIFESYILSEHL